MTRGSTNFRKVALKRFRLILVINIVKWQLKYKIQKTQLLVSWLYIFLNNNYKPLGEISLSMFVPTVKHQHHLPKSVLEVALQSTFTSVVAGSSFVKLQRNQEADLYLLENFNKSKLMLWRAFLSLKLIQIIVLLENKEGDPIFRMNFGRIKPIQMGGVDNFFNWW